MSASNGAAFLSVEEVAHRYGVSVKSIHDKTRLNGIPFTKREGFRRLLFREAHLSAWDDGAELEIVDLPDGKLVRPKPQQKG